jgi:hypothetical protein
MTPLQIAQLTEAALETIAKLANVGEHQASAALAAIRAVIGALKDGDSGKLDPQAVLTRIETLRDELAGQKAEAIGKLKERFEK